MRGDGTGAAGHRGDGQCSGGSLGIANGPAGRPLGTRGLLQPEQKIYRRIDEIPEYARASIIKLVDRGILKGIGPDDLGLTYDMIRMLIINDRAGVYD